jgi:hypothetical protein
VLTDKNACFADRGAAGAASFPVFDSIDQRSLMFYQTVLQNALYGELQVNYMRTVASLNSGKKHINVNEHTSRVYL